MSAVTTRILAWLPLVIGLALLWCLLWGGFSVMTVVTGLVLAVLVTTVLPLPPIVLSGRFNPWFALVFLFWLAVDIVLASFQVAGKATFGPRRPRNAIVEVALLTHDDLVLTAVAEAVSLVPGSLIVEVDRDGGRLFMHVLGADRPGAIDRARKVTLRTERRIIRTLGSREELALVHDALAARRLRKADERQAARATKGGR